MIIRLDLVRHGETEANRDNILQGHCDYPLTEQGVQQAKALSSALVMKSWHSIYSSDLYRAVRTTEFILDQNPNHPSNSVVQQTQLLRELSFGFREALSREYSMEEAKAEYARRNNINVDDVVDTSETSGQVKDRQVRFIQSLYNDHCDRSAVEGTDGDGRGWRVLSVAHGGFIKQFIRNFCSDLKCPGKIGNCAISSFDIIWEDDGSNKNEDRKFRIIAREEELNVIYEIN
jgi:probable phosphoglycerate mutase